MHKEQEPTARRTLNLQVDGGQRSGVFARMVFTVSHGDKSFVLGRLLATADATETAPTLDGVVMQSHTEYWLIRVDQWTKLLELYAAPDVKPKLEVSIGAAKWHHEATVEQGETAYIAPESTTWKPVTETSWQQDVLSFGASQPGPLRGIAFESTATAGLNAIIWAQSQDANLPVADVEDRMFGAESPTTDATHYALSLLTPWQG